jgi:hypothetical protein
MEETYKENDYLLAITAACGRLGRNTDLSHVETHEVLGA